MLDSQTDRHAKEESALPRRGLEELFLNIRALPQNLWSSLMRHGRPDSPRARAQTVFTNFYLHMHAIRTHRWTLKKSFTFGLGVATTVLFLILTVTGVVLMVYFKPTIAEAYNSMKDIHYIIPGGRLLRNVHRWGGHMMVVTVILHMARVFFTHSYQKPRDFNWLVGIVLLALTFALAFTGYCLPWDQLAYWAVLIGTNIAGSPTEVTDALGLTGFFDVGAFQREILLGAQTVGDEAIIRFYFLHCIGFPILTFLLLGVHFWRIRKDGGMSRPTDIRPEELKGIPKDEVADKAFVRGKKTYSLMCVMPGKTDKVDKEVENTVLSWPHAFRAEMAVCMAVLALLLVISLAVDAPLKQPGDPNVPENPAKAPWYFLGFQELVSYSAFMGGIAIPFGVLFVIAWIPFMDRERKMPGRWPDARESWWIWSSSLVTFFLIIALLAFQINLGWLRDWVPTINQIWIVLVNPGTILIAASVIAALLVIKWTGSTRLGVVVFFCSSLVSFTVLTYFGTVHRGPNWDFYWWPSQWPTH